MTTTWDEIQECTALLRLTTSRLKAKRLRLPDPGSLLQLRINIPLMPVKPLDREIGLSRGRFYRADETLLLVCVNTLVEVPYGKAVVDPVELIFLGYSGALVTTGACSGAMIMNSWKVL